MSVLSVCAVFNVYLLSVVGNIYVAITDKNPLCLSLCLCLSVCLRVSVLLCSVCVVCVATVVWLLLIYIVHNVCIDLDFVYPCSTFTSQLLI